MTSAGKCHRVIGYMKIAGAVADLLAYLRCFWSSLSQMLQKNSPSSVTGIVRSIPSKIVFACHDIDAAKHAKLFDRLSWQSFHLAFFVPKVIVESFSICSALDRCRVARQVDLPFSLQCSMRSDVQFRRVAFLQPFDGRSVCELDWRHTKFLAKSGSWPCVSKDIESRFWTSVLRMIIPLQTPAQRVSKCREREASFTYSMSFFFMPVVSSPRRRNSSCISPTCSLL